MEAAKFCRKCGADVSGQQSAVSSQPESGEAEEETRVAVRQGDVSTDQENHPVRETRPPLLRKEGSLDAVIGGDADTYATEAEIFSISPTMMFVKGGYALTALGALLLVAIVSAFFTTISAWVAVFAGLLLFLIPGYFHFRQKTVRYTLTDSKLEIDEGFISRTTRSVPISRIQDVTVSSGIAQRLLGYGNLMIDNASDEGGKVVLRNINTPRYYADVLLRQMRRLER